MEKNTKLLTTLTCIKEINPKCESVIACNTNDMNF
jgi:hypothetical protein